MKVPIYCKVRVFLFPLIFLFCTLLLRNIAETLCMISTSYYNNNSITWPIERQLKMNTRTR